MKALAIDLGGSHATCALVEDRGILCAHTFSTKGSHGLGPILPHISKTFAALLSRTQTSIADLAGLAFGFCGLVDCASNCIVATNSKYDDGPSLDLVAWCRSTFGISLRIDNDARMALLGEWYAGAARGFDDVVMMTIGTGIGGAAMIQGRLLRGKHSQAALGGHLPVHFQGGTCTCGAVGCAEAEASTASLPDLCQSTPGYQLSALAHDEPPNFEKVFRYREAGDRVAREVYDRCLVVWGTLVVGLIHAYDPEVVVVGGGVMESPSLVLPSLQGYVERHAWTPWGKVQVRSSQLKNQAALMGAIPLLEGHADL